MNDSNGESLRQRALARLEDELDAIESRVSSLSSDQVAKVVAELRVHQAELEIQNEELREAQRLLEEARDQYFDLYENAPVGYFTVTPGGLISNVNLTAQKMLDIGEPALNNKLFSRLVAPQDRDRFHFSLRVAAETGVKETCELRILAGKSGYRHMHVEFMPSLDENGLCQSHRIAIIDISERIKAEKALQHAHDTLEQEVYKRTEQVRYGRERLELAMEGGDLGMWDSMLQTDQQYCDDRLLRMLGYEPVDIPPTLQAWQDLIHPDDFSAAIDAFDRHSRRKARRYEVEGRVRNKAGNHQWLLIRGKIVERDAAGKPVRMTGTAQDITRNKEAEEHLRESEARFRAVFESVPDIIMLKDAQGFMTHVNAAAERLFGRTQEDFVGTKPEDYFQPDIAEQIRGYDQRVLAGETVEVQHERPVQGSMMRFLDVRAPMLDDQGNIQGVCVVSKDITERTKVLSEDPSKVETYPSPAMTKTLKLAGRLGRTSGTILLTGESGTGKDWLARWIHDRSPRARFAYFALNCAALPSDLAESELFGHERGAFTGAQTRKRGLLELAEGGTLLLNEIGELPLPLQSKLLTFLDTRSFIPLGGEKHRTVDARIMAATHRDLREEMAKGRFLEPLYYRLNVALIHIPPLRERPEDIPVLLQQILAELSARIYSSGIAEFHPDSIEWMYRYHWPGNIRELRNVCERAIIMSEGKRVYLTPPSDAPLAEKPIVERTPCPEVIVDPKKTLAEAKDELTAAMCRDALRRSGGNKAEAARSLGVSRDAFYRYLRQHKIKG